MTRSATDVMQDIIAAAVLDSMGALKAASKGLPNTLLRDINAIHANTTLADLPAEVQASITANVRAAFTRLLKEGYFVSAPAPARPPRPQGERITPAPRRSGPPPERERRPGPRGPRPDGPPRGPRPDGPPRGPRPDRGKPRGK